MEMVKIRIRGENVKGVKYKCPYCGNTLNALWMLVTRNKKGKWVRAPYYYCISCGRMIDAYDVVSDEKEVKKIYDELEQYKKE